MPLFTHRRATSAHSAPCRCQNSRRCVLNCDFFTSRLQQAPKRTHKGLALDSLFPPLRATRIFQLPHPPQLAPTTSKHPHTNDFFLPPAAAAHPALSANRATPPHKTKPPNPKRSHPKTPPSLSKRPFPPKTRTHFLTKRTQTPTPLRATGATPAKRLRPALEFSGRIKGDDELKVTDELKGTN